MKSLKEIIDDHKHSLYSKYGGYCEKVRSYGRKPISFHEWKEAENNN